jgi:hypothetical protein
MQSCLATIMPDSGNDNIIERVAKCGTLCLDLRGELTQKSAYRSLAKNGGKA